MSNPICTADFNWNDSEDIVCREQLALAVYVNQAGGIVIRQERAWDEDSDVYIVVQPECALRVAAAILDAAGIEASPVTSRDARVTPKDPTATDRQRRRRRKQDRDSHGETVTADRVTLSDRDSDRDELPLVTSAPGDR